MTRKLKRALENIFIGFIAVFMTAPVLVVVLQALTSANFVSFPPPGFSLRWIQEALTSERFMNAMLFSLLIATCVAIAAGVIGMAAAYAVTRYRFGGRNAFDALLNAPLMVPHIALGIAILTIEALFGIVGAPYMIFFAHLMIALVFVVRQTSVGLSGLDINGLAAAGTLGATPSMTFWRITFPQIRGPLIAGCLFAFMISFDEVGIALFLSAPRTTTLPVALYAYMDSNYDPLVMAVGSLLLIVSIIPLIAVQRTVGLARVLGLDDTPRERRSRGRRAAAQKAELAKERQDLNRATEAAGS